MDITHKTCNVCRSNKSLQDFYFSKTKTGNVSYHKSCKKCAIEARLKRYNENKEKEQIYMQQYMRTYCRKKPRKIYSEYNNSQKAKALKQELRKISKNNISIKLLTPEERQQTHLIYLMCRKLTLETGIIHHVDHIVPLCLGGEHHPKNLQILTASENLRKGKGNV